MSKLTKKRATFTLSDYREAKSKRIKPTDIDKSTDNHTTSSPIVLNNVPSSLPTSISIPTVASTHYVITKPQDGIDMCSFRLSAFTSHQVRTNISAIIRKTQNHKFIELAPSDFDKSSKTVRTTRNSRHRNRIVTNQPKISSFFSTNGISNNTICTQSSNSSVVSLLQNKTRLVVEDFMELKDSTPVVLLIPQLAIHQPPSLRSILRNNYEYNIIQFGTKSSSKYHLIPAYVKSNPYYTKFQFNLMQVTEVTSAFCEKRNNGYGISLKLSLEEDFNLGTRKLISNCFEL